MEITEVRIKLMEEAGERLQAFCSITFDDSFVIRDLKIIDGANGPFVAMPSRKLTSHCGKCGAKNHLRAGYCNDCGAKLSPNRVPIDEDGRAKLYADIAHPINSACREVIQQRVIREFRLEQERAKQPGYVPRYDDYDFEDYGPSRASRKTASPHPTVNYTQSGSEPASQVQAPEQSPPPPHKTATSESTRGPVKQAKDGPAGDPNAKLDGFGAGIF